MQMAEELRVAQEQVCKEMEKQKQAASEAEDDGSAADGENVVVKLGVVGSIYEDLWEGPAEKLKEEGIDLELVQFSDYVTPNNALDSKKIRCMNA